MHIPPTEFAHPAGESPTYDMLLACSRCATCLPACPSYAATVLETHSPRGRVQLVRALEEGGLANSAALRDALAACLDCRACETVCPNGIQPGQLAVRRRGELQGASFSRWARRLILGPALSHPGWQETGVGALRALYQRTGLQHTLRRAGLLKPVPKLARLDRYLPPLPPASVRQTVPEVSPAGGERRGRVGFFVGCAMNTLFAGATRQSIQALTRLGFDVVTPKDVVCCGAPQISSGERDLAQAMARHNLSRFEGMDAIVTDCAACGAELKHYAEMLDDPSADTFCSRVRDFAEFVEPLVPDAPRREGVTTYHAPCHLAHAQGVCRPPKALVKRLSAEYRELPEHDRCCGSAGVYWLTHPHIADQALERKLANVRATGADTVVTANPGCALQLMAGRTQEDTWQVVHISVLTNQALEPGSEEPPVTP